MLSFSEAVAGNQELPIFSRPRSRDPYFVAGTTNMQQTCDNRPTWALCYLRLLTVCQDVVDDTISKRRASGQKSSAGRAQEAEGIETGTVHSEGQAEHWRHRR